MNQFSAEGDAIRKGAELTRAAHGDLLKESSGLPARVATKGSWEGASAGSFTALIAAWNADSSRIIKALEVFESNLRGVDVNYTNADQSNADALKRLSSGLTGA